MTERTASEEARHLVDLGLLRPSEASDVLNLVGNGSGQDLMALLERRQLLTPFQLQKLQAGDTTGYYVGRYKILYLIAGGTFARVFRAIDPNTEEVVAVKILRDRHTSDQENIKQFLREGRLMEQLVHPNVTRMLEVGTDAVTGQHYIAMEFVEGGNLREFLKIRKKIDPKEFVRLAIQMVEGLKYAFMKGLTHRDIKPTNILISASGDIKWVDFGLGGVVEGEAKSSDAAKNEVGYAGLEKVTNAPKGDPRSDIFFLGMVFYELITGEHPLGGRDKESRKREYQRYAQIPLLSRRDDVPVDIATIIDKMVAFRPESRYQNLQLILTDLQKITYVVETAGVAAQAPGLPRVVIVHHSSKVQEILKGKLSRRGFQSVVTNDVLRAAVLCKMKPAECIVIDLDTTGEDGIAQYRSMLRSGAVKSGVFLTSPGQEDWLKDVDSTNAIQLGKPLVLGPVYQSVRGLVERFGQDHPRPV